MNSICTLPCSRTDRSRQRQTLNSVKRVTTTASTANGFVMRSLFANSVGRKIEMHPCNSIKADNATYFTRFLTASVSSPIRSAPQSRSLERTFVASPSPETAQSAGSDYLTSGYSAPCVSPEVLCVVPLCSEPHHSAVPPPRLRSKRVPRAMTERVTI